MTARVPDALELLLPDAAPPVWQRAQRVTTFLRLLAHDAKPAGPPAVQVSLERARGELERETRGRVLAALDVLLRLHLRSALGPESFLASGEEQGSAQEHWSALAELREDLPWLARVPEPDEPAREVAARLLDCAERAGMEPGAIASFRARLARACAGPAAAESEFRALLAQAGAPGLRRAALAHVAECLLDRGAVRAARDLLDEHAESVLGDERLRRLAVWVRLLLGDAAGARVLHSGMAPAGCRLPAALCELRDARPEWLPLLWGKADDRPWSPVPRDARIVDRQAVGASLLAVFALTSDGSARALSCEAAPALRARVARWLRERDGAARDPGEPEQCLVATTRRQVLHAAPGEPLRSALDPESALALVLEPVRDADGEIAGWLRLEFEHHLVPATAMLEAFARGWRADVLAAGRGTAAPARPSTVLEAPRADAEGPVAQAFAELVDALAIKTAQRHWWAFAVDGERLELVAEGGCPLASGGPARAPGRALTRAHKSGGHVLFEESEPGLALHADSASGVVLPLRMRGRLCGLIALESARRRDFRASDVERLAPRVEAFGGTLRLAGFREWHRRRFGFDVRLPHDARSLERAAKLTLAARARVPIAFWGAPATGKRVLARFVHFEGGADDAPWVGVRCGGRGEADATAALCGARGHRGALERARGGTLLLEGIDRLPSGTQARLAEVLDTDGGSAHDVRLLATARAPMEELAASGAIVRELAERLARLEFRVAPLCERREEIPELARLIVRRFAREGREPVPELDDGALALLWRQPWPGNLRQLESLLYKLALFHRSAPVGPAELERVAGQFGVQLLRKLPSRHPDAALLSAALATTRNRCGTWNKTRAALYLGWDPDTLVARMNDAGIAADGEVGAARTEADCGIGPRAENGQGAGPS